MYNARSWRRLCELVHTRLAPHGGAKRLNPDGVGPDGAQPAAVGFNEPIFGADEQVSEGGQSD